MRWLRRRRLVSDEADPFNNEPREREPLDACLEGSLGIGALTKPNKSDPTAAQDEADRLPTPTKAQRRGGQHRGFDVHAGVVVSGQDCAGRERLFRTYTLWRDVELSNDDVRGAHALIPERGPSDWQVKVELTSAGARILERLTTAQLHRRLAIVVDTMVESAPRVMTPISAGAFSLLPSPAEPERQRRGAEQLARVLSSGPLAPALGLVGTADLAAP